MLSTLLALALSAANPTAAFTPKSRPYDATHYRIDFKLLEGGAFENKATITLKARSALSSIELDARGLEVKTVTVDGAEAKFTVKADPALNTGTLTVKPAKAIARGKEATVVVTYSGKAGLPHAGLFEVTDSRGTWYFTQFQTTHARAFFPCNDQPDDKATTEIFAVVDAKMKVLSNGRKELDETFAEGGKTLRRVHWKQDQPHSTYLVALAIGAFEPVLTGGDIPSTVWVRPGSQDRAFAAVDAMRASVNFQQNYLGVKYPWARLDAVAVPHFYWSGMENTSLIFWNSCGS
jgi:aminopeptidase N